MQPQAHRKVALRRTAIINSSSSNFFILSIFDAKWAKFFAQHINLKTCATARKLKMLAILVGFYSVFCHSILRFCTSSPVFRYNLKIRFRLLW